MTTTTAADVLVRTLKAWGVDVVFGIPGDGNNGIMEALRKRRDAIRFIQVRHEESAAFMACGYAKYTGRLGVCLATSGPGGIHLLNGLYDAKLDGAPVLAITGLQFHDLVHTHTQQDVELDKLFMDVAVYNTRVMGPAHVENSISLACRTALAYRGVAHVTIPVDMQSQAVKEDDPSARNVAHHVSAELGSYSPVPSKDALKNAAAVLNAGKKVAILVGRGALGARHEVLAAAESLGAPVAKALLGKGVIPDEHPVCVGGVGLLGTTPAYEALAGCDTLLLVGSSFPYIEFYPKPGAARAVQIDADPQRIGLRYPAEVGLVGDAAKTLQALLPLLETKGDRSFLEAAQTHMKAWNELLVARASRTDFPMKPQAVAHELGRILPENAIIAADSGTNTTWAARHIPIRGEQMFSVSGNLATMACGLPYAIAAAIAYPERMAVAFVGDGGMTMLMGELATCVKYNLNVKIVVIKNNALGQIKWEQMIFLGNPEYGCDLQPIDFAAVAEACGVRGFRIDRAEDCAAILAQALREPGPVLIEAVVDPHEPPMPPKATLADTINLAKALARGTPDGKKILKTITEDTIRELI